MAISQRPVHALKPRQSKKKIVVRRRRGSKLIGQRKRNTVIRRKRFVSKPSKTMVQQPQQSQQSQHQLSNGGFNNNCPIETNPFQLGDGPVGGGSPDYQTFSNANASNLTSMIDQVRMRPVVTYRRRPSKRRLASTRRTKIRRPNNLSLKRRAGSSRRRFGRRNI